MTRKLYNLGKRLGLWVEQETGLHTDALAWQQQGKDGRNVVMYEGPFGSNEFRYVGLDDTQGNRVYIRQRSNQVQGVSLDDRCESVEINAELRAVVMAQHNAPQTLAEMLASAVLKCPQNFLLNSSEDDMLQGITRTRLLFDSLDWDYVSVWQEETGREEVKGQSDWIWAAVDFELQYEVPINCLPSTKFCDI